MLGRHHRSAAHELLAAGLRWTLYTSYFVFMGWFGLNIPALVIETYDVAKSKVEAEEEKKEEEKGRGRWRCGKERAWAWRTQSRCRGKTTGHRDHIATAGQGEGAAISTTRRVRKIRG